MPSSKKQKTKQKNRKSRARNSNYDLNRILMNNRVTLQVRRNWDSEFYEPVQGVYRGIFRLKGDYMIAIDEVDENDLSLRRRHFYVDDVREIDLERPFSNK